MGPENLRDLEVGSTLMLAREIMSRENVSQVYEKVDDTTVKHRENGESVPVRDDELVYRFDPNHIAS